MMTMDIFKLWTIFAIIFILTLEGSNSFHFDLDPNSGNFKVTVNNLNWLSSKDYFITLDGQVLNRSSWGTAKKENVVGSDQLGSYKLTKLSYNLMHLKSGETIVYRLLFKTYDDHPSVILFGQDFHGPKFINTSVEDANKLSSGFPSFTVDKAADLGFLAFGGHMSGDVAKRVGRWNTDSKAIVSGLDSGPLVLFDQDGSALIISPFSHFMVMSAVYTQDSSGNTTATWGLLGKLESIPQHTHAWTILYYSGEGINMAIEGWGSLLRKFYGKQDAYVMSDFTNNYLSYWTDNGGYYYYKTEPNKTYEETIIDVFKDADNNKIPFRYIEYDSWWYYKVNAGVTEWYATPDVFPDGMQYVWNRTGIPIMGHNRWWSPATVYAKQNGGKYNFIIENTRALPNDAQFWNDLMQNATRWGLINYEQDWLNVQFDTMKATVSDIHLARDWLIQMGNGARKNGVTVQYCMATSRHTLQSLEIPAVTQTRVSDDYTPGNKQWKIGVTSMFAYAVGLAPFKDNFWSTSNQTGSPYGDDAYEPNPDLQVAVSTISTAGVASSDKIGCQDHDVIMRCCNAEGLILKPERPARAIDDQMINTAYQGFTGEVWSTHTYISGHLFGIIFAADFGPDDKMAVTPKSARFETKRQVAKSIVFSHKTKDSLFTNDNPLRLSGCSIKEFCIFYVSPVFVISGKELIIYGEMDKWVPMSKQRVKNIELVGSLGGADNVKIEIEGAVGETINFYMSYDGEDIVFKCELHGSGTRIIDFAQRSCVYNR